MKDPKAKVTFHSDVMFPKTQTEKSYNSKYDGYKADFTVVVQQAELLKKSRGKHKRSKSESFLGLPIPGISSDAQFRLTGASIVPKVTINPISDYKNGIPSPSDNRFMGLSPRESKLTKANSMDYRVSKASPTYSARPEQRKIEPLLSLKELRALVPKPKAISDFSSEEIKTATDNFSVNLKRSGLTSSSFSCKMNGTSVLVTKVKSLRVADYVREIIRMKRVPHPNVLPLLGCCFEENCVVSQSYGGLCLADRLLDTQGVLQPPMTWNEKLQTAIELVSAVMYLKSAGLLRASIDASKVLFDEEGSVRLDVFGSLLSHFHSSTKHQKDAVASLGLTILQMCANEPNQTETETKINLFRLLPNRDLNFFLPKSVELLSPCEKKEALQLVEVGISCAMEESKKNFSLATVLQRLSSIQPQMSGLFFSPGFSPSPAQQAPSEFRDISSSLTAEDLKDVICLCRAKPLVEKSIQILIQKAENGDPEAQVVMGEAYLYGWGSFDVSIPLAYKWMTSANELGLEEAIHKLEDLIDFAFEVLKNPSTSSSERVIALNMLKKGSVDGHSFAKFRLGECYESGLSVPVDYLAAMDYFLVSAREGIEEGLEKFFVLATKTICEETDTFLIGQAVQLLTQQAEEENSTEAKFIIGECFRNGWGTFKVEYDHAYDWLSFALHGKHPLAREKLVELFDGVYHLIEEFSSINSGSVDKHVKLLLRASKHGFPEAQAKLAHCYLNGIGAQKAECRAVGLYSLAANSGLPEAQNSLGSCYLHGFGVEVNEKKAAGWFSMAARKGYGEGEWNLGLCLESGIGAKKSSSLSRFWMKRAANRQLPLAVKGLSLRDATYFRPVQFKCRFSDISKSTSDCLSSGTFHARGFNWKLTLEPRGDSSKKHVSIFLSLAQPNLVPSQWRSHVNFSLSLVNQNDSSLTRTKQNFYEFSNSSPCGGNKYHTPIQTALNPNLGFVKDDAMEVECSLAIEFGMSPEDLLI